MRNYIATGRIHSDVGAIEMLVHKRCESCGQLIFGHPAHHRFCRRCFGYQRLGCNLAAAMLNIKAVLP